jgi:hypothetical protein
MKNYQLLEIKKNWNELKTLSGNKGYYLPLVKNIKSIDIELEAFDLLKTKSKEFDEFLKEKDILLQKYAKLDDKGNPVKSIETIEGNQYYKYETDPVREKEFNVEGLELMGKYESVLKEMQTKESLYISTMNEEATLTIHKIKECNLPSEMTPEQLEMIYDFIEFE